MRVLSGIQPSGPLHIGNYLGAIRQYLALQADNDAFYFVANYHALTSVRNAETLRGYVFDVLVDFLALGLDPDRATLFVQSDVPETTELAWLLSTVTPMGWLEKCVSYKDKVQQGLSSDHGLFAYPVLQAADILIYDADLVPVGQDQKQHLEITRDIAERFNSIYGDTFVVPETKLPGFGARIMGLDDPTAKMSKSAAGAHHAIALLDPADKIRKTFNRATTDSNPAVDFETMGPGVQNLLNIYQAFSNDNAEAMRNHFTGMRYGDLKKQVAEMVIAHLEPLQQRYQEITKDPAYVESILQQGAERVRPLADETVHLTKQRMGLW